MPVSSRILVVSHRSHLDTQFGLPGTQNNKINRVFRHQDGTIRLQNVSHVLIHVDAARDCSYHGKNVERPLAIPLDP